MKERNMKEGIIYKVTNEINGQCYIGATTHSLNERKSDHINKIDKDYGYKFHRALQEFGVENFYWEEIDTATNLNELALKESDYIEKYDSFNNGYNSDRGGGFKKIIYQFNLTGELVTTFNSLAEASKSTDVPITSISKACLGDRNTCNGFFWNYTATFDIKEDKRKNRIEQYTLENEYLGCFNSISEASKITGVNKSSIAKCCRGERKKAGNFIWKLS